jgi:integrase
VTTSTEPVLLDGVERYGAGYRVRIRFPKHLVPSGRHIETVRTNPALRTPGGANARALALVELREAGVSPIVAAAQGRTLADATGDFLRRKKVSGRNRQLRRRGVEFWERSCRPWLEGEHASTPLSLLRRDQVETTILARALLAPTSARNELQALKATLRHAADPAVDPSIFTIEPIATCPRTRRALTLDELDLLAACAPDYARRLVWILGTAGFRVGELFTLTDDRLDLHSEAPAAVVTAELAKERLPKRVAFDTDQVQVVREQLMARAPGTRLVFATKTGKAWTYRQFHKLVWKKTTHRAAQIWRHDRGLDEHAATPFDDLKPHDLRSTAATLMREAGFTREEAADRLGHVDSGELLDRVYDQGDRGQRAARAIAAKTPAGLRAALAERAAPSTRPTTAALGAPEATA